MSLKAKLFGIVAIITIASIACLSFGQIGSSNIISTVDTVRNETYPILMKSTLLKQIVLDSNNAIILAIDGDDLFSEDLLDSQKEFNKIVKDMSSDGHDQELKSILEHYNDFVKEGLKEGKALIDKPDSDPNSIMKVSEKSHLITQKIIAYADQKQLEFSKALDAINLQAITFRNIFSWSGLGLLLAVAFLLALIVFLVKAISKLTADAKTLASGDLNQLIQIDRNDELGMLQQSFEKMRESLNDHIKNLDLKVEERTHALNLAKKEVQDILDAISQGIITFDFDMNLYSGHSKEAELIFSKESFENLKLSNILNLNDKQIEEFEKWIRILRKSKKLRQFKKNAKLSPIDELILIQDDEERIINLDYQPVFIDDELNRIMILAEDITEKRKVELALSRAKLEQEANMNRVICLITHQISDTSNFIDGVTEFTHDLQNYHQLEQLRKSVDILFRTTHTARGSSATLGFNILSNILMNLEDFLDLIRKGEQGLSMGTWNDHLDDLIRELEEIDRLRDQLFKSSSDTMQIKIKSYDQIVSDLFCQKLTDPNEILERFRNLDSIDFIEYSDKYQKLVKRIAEKLGKDISPLSVRGDQIRRDVANYFDELIAHLIRNALDHGIESNEERSKKDRGLGHIHLNYQFVDKTHTLILEDNGAGIDIEKVWKKSIEKGLCSSDEVLNDREKLELIYRDSISTKDVTSDISGRGVGMSAIKENVEKMDGTIQIETELNSGTKFTLTIPDDSFIRLNFELMQKTC